MSVSRMFEMLYILLERDRVTASELARRLEVSVRTVYRDAQALCEAGIPLCAERGRDGGLSILPGCRLNRALLTEQERSGVLAALRAMQQTGADDGQTLRRLSAFLGGDAPDWVRIDLADWSGKQGTLIATIRSAILERRHLAFDYCGESGLPAPREVCPLTLWFKGRAWYLHAYCLTRRTTRTFKLSRIRRAHIVEGGFPPEALAAAQAGIPREEAVQAPLIPLVLRVDGCMAFRVLDDFREEEITPLEDGGFLIRTAFPPGAWIVSFVLGYGEHAEVLEPVTTRNAVRDALRGALSRYEGENFPQNTKT